MFDDMQPRQVAGHEDGQRCEAQFSRRILTERCEHFQQNENHDVGVHDVVQPAAREKIWIKMLNEMRRNEPGQNGIQHFGQYKLSIDVPQRPEGDAHV